MGGRQSATIKAKKGTGRSIKVDCSGVGSRGSLPLFTVKRLRFKGQPEEHARTKGAR
jgi:hypothetical protein